MTRYRDIHTGKPTPVAPSGLATRGYRSGHARLIMGAMALPLMLLSSCQRELVTAFSPEQESAQSMLLGGPNTMTDWVPGTLLLKLSEDRVPELRHASGVITMSTAPSMLSHALQSIGAVELMPLYPTSGRFAERRRRAGLNRWYTVHFDETIPVHQAMMSLQAVPEVEVAEGRAIPHLTGNAYPLANIIRDSYFDRDISWPFREERAHELLHLNNMGTMANTVKGADINMKKAWEITTGTPNVIVCVVDGGISINHPDLKDNLWVNDAELNGTPGKDDDGNGYVDDVYGYDFVIQTPDILPDEISHGTHVAGILAARNNNGIGISGVAGGDGRPNSGIRMMSAAIFRDGVKKTPKDAEAIVYGADNGAVISQNSWGFMSTSGVKGMPQALAEAVDYFVKYAGCDENGNQLPHSPMKGGLVVFAAGNEGIEYNGYPASYPAVVSVASAAPDYTLTGYSTYGTAVDILAFGGAKYLGNPYAVLSTTDPNHSKSKSYYDYMDGTSMACPQVSGVAALVVSKMGGPGFTADMLKERILSTVQPINVDEVNPTKSGRVGLGYLDAYAALTMQNEKKAPQTPVEDVVASTEQEFLQIPLTWTVPQDDDDGVPATYEIYYSTEKLTQSNYATKGRKLTTVNGRGKRVGDRMTYTISNLKHSTTYYVAVVAIDRWGLRSPAAIEQIATKTNHPAMLSNVPEDPVTLTDSEGKVSFELKVEELDGHSWTYDTAGQLKGVSHARKEGSNTIIITLRPVLESGNYTFSITTTDELGSTSTHDIPFRIVRVHPPRVSQPIEPLVVGIKEQGLKVKLADHFVPQQGVSYVYRVSSGNASIAKVQVEEHSGLLTISPIRTGQTTINVDVTGGGHTTRMSIELMVAEDSTADVYSIWPIPFRQKINLRISPKYPTVSVRLYTLDGVEVLHTRATADFSGLISLDTSRVAPGVYCIVVDNGQSKPFTKTILKR